MPQSAKEKWISDKISKLISEGKSQEQAAAIAYSMWREGLSKREVCVNLPIVKIDDDQRLATGWVAVVTDASGQPIVDADGHVIPIVELEKAVHYAFAEGSGKDKGGDQHEKKAVADFVESFVVTTEKRKALGLGDGPEGWIATLKINDDTLWQKVKTGERPELSMRGTGEATEI